MTKIINSNFKYTLFQHFYKKKFLYLVLFVSAFVLYGNTLSHEYALDDQLAIYDNTFVTKGFDGIQDILTHDAFVGFFGDRGSTLISGGRYRPLSFVTFAIEWQFFGKSPQVSHFINVLLFGFLVCSIFYFLSFLVEFHDEFIPKWAWMSFSFVAALLYSFHPIHTEVVANIKGRDEILCFLFSIWAITASFVMNFKTERANQFFVFILFFLALMSKENAITFLGVLALVYVFKNKTIHYKELGKLYIPFIVATIAFLILRSKYTQASLGQASSEVLNNPFVYASASETWATIFYSFIKYLQLLVFPYHLSHDYYFNQIPYKTFSNPWVIASILLGIAILYYLVKTKWYENKVAFSLVFFFLTFSIVSNVFFTVGIIMNERFVFISSLGFSILYTWFLHQVYLKSNQLVVFVILGITLLLYGFKTIDRNRAWYNNYTLFSTDYHISSNSSKVSTSFGGTLLDSAKVEKNPTKKSLLLDSALRVLEHAIAIYPENPQPMTLYAGAKFEKNKNTEEAIQLYKQALKYRPDGFFDADYNIAVLYYNSKNYDSALTYARIANAIRPNDKEVSDVYADLLSRTGNSDVASQLVGGDPQKLADLSSKALNANRINDAFNLANQALSIAPDNGLANYVKGIVLSRFQNQLAQGIPFLEKAANSQAPQALWLEDLAVAYGMTGRVKETIPILERAIQIDPNSKSAYQNLATTYARMGNQQKADYYFQLSKSK